MAYAPVTNKAFGNGAFQMWAATAPAAGAAFAPTDLTGLLAWWKADALALSNGAAVSSWADSSGNTRTLAQASGTLQPIYNTAQQNGLPAVTFDGTNDYLATGAFASPTAGATLFVVHKLTSLDQYRTVLCHAAAASWSDPYARVLARVSDVAGSNAWQFFVETAASNVLQEGAPAVAATWELMSFVHDASNEFMYRNGTQVATQVRVGTLTSSTQAVFVGADTSLADNWKGQVGEIVYYNRGLNSTERGQVRTYLMTKWGL